MPATGHTERGSADLAEIYREFARPVYGLCLQMLGSKEAAQDAAGEVFARLPRALGSYDTTLPMANWLYRVASNYCLDLLRMRRREERYLADEPVEALPVASPEPSPLANLEDAEQRKALRSAIAGLPDKHRVPLVLHYFNGLDYDAIGREMGLKRGHVGTLLFRARQELRRVLSGPSEGVKP